jgi:putative flippase GtrA
VLFNHINKKEIKGFFNFFLTGVFGASVNFLSQIPFKTWFLERGLEDSSALFWSVFWAYMIATAVSFLPAKVFAFGSQDSGNSSREWLKFFFIAALALGVQEVVTIISLREIINPFFGDLSPFFREKGAHLTGMAVSFMANFLGHRFFTFRSTGIYQLLRP